MRWALCSSKMVPVDETWTKKELQDECKNRGLAGYSRLNKASLLVALKTASSADKGGGGGGGGGKDLTKMTVAELREECRRRGLRSYSKLKKDELIRLLKGGTNTKTTSKVENNAKPGERTLEDLRAECRKRGMTGFSHLKKKELIRRMEDYDSLENSKGTSTTRPLTGRAKIKRTLLLLGKGGKEKEEQQRLSARKKGPLRSRAQERFDAGPSPQDTPGFLYVYSEPGSDSSGSGGEGTGAGRVKEWKIGKTILDPPERRMNQSAQNNRKVYKLHASWYVPWCGFVEKIVHLDLDDFHVVPGKEKKWAGGGREDGGTEWFRTDIDVIEARVKLAIRMVAAREADEADSLGAPVFCGIFRCGLPKRRWRRHDPQAVEV